MLIVLVVWGLDLLCMLGLGHVLLRWLGGPGRNGPAGEPPYVVAVAGLAGITALGMLWNYAAPIGAWFHGTLLVLAAVALLACRSAWRQAGAAWLGRWREKTGWTKGAWAVLVLIALFKSISPPEVADEGAYFLPYIRWIEQYPVIPGLGNIEDRLGFNSAFHMASASLGWAWLIPGGAYKLNGLLLALFSAWCLGGLDRVLGTRQARASDVMKLLCLFFLMRNAVTCTAADLSNMLLTETAFILFLEKIESGSVLHADRRFWAISITALLVATIKLSSLPVVLVPAYLWFRMLAGGQRLPWARLLLVSGILVLPWLGRFTVLSGYIVYPAYQVDLLNVDWKVPHAVAERQYHYVQEYAKTNTPASDAVRVARERAFLGWVPRWFHRENLVNRAMALVMLAAWASLLVHGLLKPRRAFSAPGADRTAFGLLLLASVAFWFVSNPAFRFGWAWGIVLVAFWLHAWLSRYPSGALRAVTLGVFSLSLLSNAGKTVLESRSIIAAHLVKPAPVPTVRSTAGHIGPLEVRVAEGSGCWGTAPPCLPRWPAPGLEARGMRVTDGFRTAAPPRRP